MSRARAAPGSTATTPSIEKLIRRELSHSPHLRRGGEPTSAQAKRYVTPIPKTLAIRKAKSRLAGKRAKAARKTNR